MVLEGARVSLEATAREARLTAGKVGVEMEVKGQVSTVQPQVMSAAGYGHEANHANLLSGVLTGKDRLANWCLVSARLCNIEARYTV